MHTPLLLALLPILSATSVLASAHPAPPTAPSPDLTNDGAATLYKAPHLGSGPNLSSPTDYTPLPTDGQCLELGSLYGGWEGAARSVVVRRGWRCDFYREPKCPATSAPLCLNAGEKKVTMETLPAEWDRKIVSVKCARVSSSSPSSY